MTPTGTARVNINMDPMSDVVACTSDHPSEFSYHTRFWELYKLCDIGGQLHACIICNFFHSRLHNRCYTVKENLVCTWWGCNSWSWEVFDFTEEFIISINLLFMLGLSNITNSIHNLDHHKLTRILDTSYHQWV